MLNPSIAGYSEKEHVNRVLGRFGLAQLNEAGALVTLALFVEDHAHFKRLLNKCEPDQRRNMYVALVPHLRFEAKPLDVYMSEIGQDAERRQLPVIAPDGGLRPFKVSEIKSDEYIAEQAIAAEMLKHHLTLTCARCTKQEVFHGERKADAIYSARAAGWTYNEINSTGRETCPMCNCLAAN